MTASDDSETAERKESFMQPATVFGIGGLIHSQGVDVGMDRMRNVRERFNFDFDWYFLRGDLWNHVVVKHTPTERWRKVQLPHDWSVEYPLDEANPSGPGGGYVETGIGWYRKEFVLPEFCKDNKVIIEFDGVYMNSQVWINDQYLGKRPNGYITFRYDLTEHLTFGKDNPNLIAVRVNNSAQPNSRWYTGSGIYRHVWLTITDKVHLDPWETFITTPEITDERAKVETKTILFNETATQKNVVLRTTVLDKDGNPVASVESPLQLTGPGETELVKTATVRKPTLWSVDHPYLYRVRNEIVEDGNVIDRLDTNMGIRYMEFNADTGFFLNGQPMKFKARESPS